MTVGPKGVILTPFADEICLQEDLEVSLVSLPVTVLDISFPMCPVAASLGQHKAVRPRTDGIPAWPLHQVPCALMQCSVEMPSGHVLFLLQIRYTSQEGFILHGSNPETRAEIYRLLLHREIKSNPREAAQEVLVYIPLWLKLFGSNPPNRWAGGSRNSLKEKRDFLRSLLEPPRS